MSYNQLFDTRTRRLMALSLWQPWGSLIAYGFKQYETRSWYSDYRGPLVIQAAKSTKGLPPWNSTIMDTLKSIGVEPNDLPRGCALCVVDLVEVVRAETVRDSVSEYEKAFGDWRTSRFVWKLENPRRIDPPIPMRGYQQIFDIDPETRQRIMQAVGMVSHEDR